MILFGSGRSRQWTVINASGHTKDADYIHDTCAEIYTQISAAMGPQAKCLGFIMDNTSANKSAIRKLEVTFSWMVCLGCCAHSFSLLIKDLAKALGWLGLLYSLCIMISNLANGTEALKAALSECMNQSYTVVRGICSHVDTRFGSKHFVLRDIQRSHAALMAWTISDTFTDHMIKSDPPAHISEVYDGMLARNRSPSQVSH